MKVREPLLERQPNDALGRSLLAATFNTKGLIELRSGKGADASASFRRSVELHQPLVWLGAGPPPDADALQAVNRQVTKANARTKEYIPGLLESLGAKRK